jgi:hypothetical protein
VLALVACNKNAETSKASPKLKRYPYENVHIKYEAKGSAEGTDEKFIADYGRYEAVYSEFLISTEQGTMPRKQMVITKEGDVYQVDLIRNQGKHAHVQVFDSLYKLRENIPTLEDMKTRLLTSGQFQPEGHELINGLLCERWHQAVGPITLFLYNNLVLKKIVEGQKGEYSEFTATLVDTAWKYDSTKFAIPQMEYEPMKAPGTR